MKTDNEALVFGLDIGTRSVVGTVGYKEGEKFIVVAQEIREHQTRAMLDGQIHDINRVAATISEIKKCLEEASGSQLEEVCIAAAGRVLRTVDTHVEMDLDKERTVTSQDISNLISMGVEKAFEDFQQENESEVHFYCVGYSIVRYYLNGMWMGQPEHHKAKNVAVDMIATFLPDDVVDGLYKAVELAGLKVANLTLEPIAAIRVAIPEKFRLLNIAMIDIGAGTSDISITNEGSVVAFGMIPQAGDGLTEIIAQKCLVDFVTAEKIKTEAEIKSTIIYEDIMGLEQTISSDEVLALCQAQIDKMAKLASDEIKKLNGGTSPSAVFIVGGGGKIKGFSDKVAEELGLDPKRVALRGEEIMGDVEFPKDCKKDSTIITPIGICLSYYEQNNNFINVTFNGSKMKIYDNNKLVVMDAAIQAAFSREGLFPKRGEDICYKVNGNEYISKGEYGESAKVFVNGEAVNLNHSIKANDVIVIEESTIGNAAGLKVSDLEEYTGDIFVTVNGKEIQLPELVNVNGKSENADYVIQNGDEITTYEKYTYGQLFEYIGESEDDNIIIANGEEVLNDDLVQNEDVIEIHKKASAAIKELEQKKAQELQSQIEARTEKNNSEIKTDEINVSVAEAASQENNSEEPETINQEPRKMVIIVNKNPVVMEGKAVYTFVDIFDYINFDTSRMQGSALITLVNGVEAKYTQQLFDGDKIDIYWKK